MDSIKRVFKKALKIIGILFAFLIVIVCITGIVILILYGDTIKECYSTAKKKVEEIGVNEFSGSQTSLIYDADNNLLMKIKGDKENYYLLYEEIPDTVKNAFISIEDHRFLQHNGVDYISMVRAAFAILSSNGELVQGGSTITQQLARNIFLSTDKTLSRKITEIFIAVRLEHMYSKSDILEFYINNINYGYGCYGIESAAKEYFGTSVKNLTDAQMITLCAIPQNPTYNDPRKYMTNTLRRKDNIVRAMEKYGAITSVQAKKIMAEKITVVDEEESSNNYLETYAKFAATEAIMDKVLDFTFKYNLTDKERKEYEESYQKTFSMAEKLLKTNGYTIYTSLSLSQQGIVQNNLDAILSDYTVMTSDNEYSLQGAVTLIDNQTGLVTAIVGGRTPINHVYTLNRAFQSYRQPGSSIKPLIAYIPYFEDETHNYTDILKDFVSPAYEGQKVPKGTGKRSTIINAVKWSYNGIPWNIVRELTPEKSLSYLQSMCFHKLVDSDKVEAISLGGFTNGVSTLEMASAFSALSRNGMFIRPSCIVKIVDNTGSVIYSHKKEETRRVYSEQACQKMRICLETVVNGGTGAAAKVSGIDTAGKTGTSNDEKDSWFVGFTPYYTAAVWVGHDIPKSEPSVSSRKITATLFSQIMTPLHKPILEGEPETIRTFNKMEETTSQQSESIFDKILSEIDLLSNVKIESMESYKEFDDKYMEIKSIIDSGKDVLENSESLTLSEKLEDVKRAKWEDILKITNVAQIGRGWVTTDSNDTDIIQQE